MKIVKYDKLVRDNIPDIIEKDGKSCVTEVLNEMVYKQKLMEKLGEELQELIEEINKQDDKNAIKELADIQEVIFAFLPLFNISKIEFEKVRLEKVEKNGAFKKRLLLKGVRE